MNSKWLFRVNVGKERSSGDKEAADGLGHAIRCLSLARAVTDQGGTVHFSIEGAVDVEELFDEAGVTYDRTTDHDTVIEGHDPDVIVTDINYLDAAEMAEYRARATTVNLAPRGDTKYYADYTFTSGHIEDVPRPPDQTLKTWYAGPEYAILNPQFTEYRRQMSDDLGTAERSGVVVQMGGVDEFNITGTVLRALTPDSLSGTPLTVVAGPYNPHVSELRDLALDFPDAEVAVNPDELASLVAGHRVGIFAAGISTYEALAVGVPSVNVGHTAFHDARGDLLESKGLSRYVGNHDEFSADELNDQVLRLLTDDALLEDMRDAGLETVDGRATERIVSTVTDLV